MVVAIAGVTAVEFCELLVCTIVAVEFSAFDGGTVGFCDQVTASTMCSCNL